MFQIGLEIWGRDLEQPTSGKQICRQRYLTLLGEPMVKLEMSGALRDFSRQMKLRLIEDKFNTITCPTKNCSFTSTQRWNFRRHVQKCSGETIYVHKQRSYGLPENKELNELRSEGFLPKEEIKKDFAVYDIGNGYLRITFFFFQQ